MFTVYLTNMGYSLTPSFNTFEDAVAACERAGFECHIFSIKEGVIAIWNPFSGLSKYPKSGKYMMIARD